MSAHKGPHPGDDGMEKHGRPAGGRFNKKTLGIGVGGLALAAIGLYSIAGITQEVDREEPKGLQPASITARAPETPLPAAEPVAEAPAPTQKPGPNQPTPPNTEKPVQRERQEQRGRPAPAPNKNFKVATLAFNNQHMGSVIKPYLDGSAMGGEESTGGSGGMTATKTGARSEGSGERSDGHGSGNAKGSFYTNGGGRSKQGLYHPHSLQPELAGCVLKAGEEIVIESPNPVRTELPGQVRGRVVEDAWGFVYLGNGQQEECLAIPAGSTTMAEVNASGVSRGDLRIQMCATRIDLLGGGIMPMDCSPTLGQDGSFGVEAESDYNWGGVATGILIEAALATISGLGNLIEGPAGIAVNVGTQGMRGVGSEYVNRELMRPPVLTMQRGAIYRIQVNADISFPGE